jgi:hypothetical protein
MGLALALGAAWYFRDPQRRARFPALARLIDGKARRRW